ncbi:MAG: hypothetical protein AAF515_19330 [Pseudomonadota bacterium]
MTKAAAPHGDSLNLDAFFGDAARALLLLVSAFPRPVILQVDDIYRVEETDEFGMHSERYLACFAALQWLAEEGYLRYEETIRSEAIDQARLSARCFVLLTRPRPALSDTGLPATLALEQSSVASELRAGLAERSSAAVRRTMLTLMATMSGLADDAPPNEDCGQA